MDVWIYSIVSVFIVSLISLIGIASFVINESKLRKVLIYFVSFSAGALFGDVFIHLLPKLSEKGFSLNTSLYILSGIILSFILEKIICWQHCHMPITKHHVHRFAYMNLFGDIVHNFIDGLIIGASYLASLPIGIATTVAVVLHEIPQEIGDFGILLHGGFSKNKAIFYNFITALAAVVGTVTALILFNKVENINQFLISLAAGSFIYIAGSDLIPELHKEVETKKGLIQIGSFILGIVIMLLLLLLE